jgi:hypothetical protein
VLVEEQVGDRKRPQCLPYRAGIDLEAVAAAGLRREQRGEEDYGDSATSTERIGGRLRAASSQSAPAFGET